MDDTKPINEPLPEINLNNELNKTSGAPVIDATVAGFLEKHGEKNLVKYLQGYRDKIMLLNELNLNILEIDQDKDPEDYEIHVKTIIEATNDYYEFIGTLPGDIRNFLMEMQTLQRYRGKTKEIIAVQDILGFEMPMDTPEALSIRAIKPKNYVMQIDVISNQLAALENTNNLKVGGKGNRLVLTTVTLDMPDHMRIEGGGSLTSYDKSILNGVTSLMESGNTVFSIPMLYHTMTGRNNPSIDDGLYEELSSKLEKMRRMMLTIDLTKENEAHFFTNQKGEQIELRDLSIEGYLLPLNRVTGKVNGKKTELYQIIQPPPLYSYSKMKRQLASVKLKLLSAPVNNNMTTIPLKTYLLQRIEMMKNENNSITSKNILYDSIYKELGELDANKTRKKRIRSYTISILDYFVEQGYLQGYNEYKSGRSIAGLSLELTG